MIKGSMRAGETASIQAFYSELGVAIAENLIALKQADAEQRKQIAAEISDHLSAFEKAEVLAGTLNLDDGLGVVNGINAEIKELQDELKGKGSDGGPPLPKDYILKEIRRIREQELKPAEAELKAARAALQACRARQGMVSDFQGAGMAAA